VAAANWAIENLDSEVLVLDDGFQNLRTARDLNIVTIDASNPWGNEKLFPAGSLREPVDALKRANCVVITRAGSSISRVLLQAIKHITNAPIVTSRVVISASRLLNSHEQPIATQIPQPVAAFCAIGNPEAFFTTLRAANHEICETFTFRDHYHYLQANIDEIIERSKVHGAKALVTTAKDEVKLRSMRFDLPCYVADIAIEIDEEDKLLESIEAAISRKRTSSS
jgi:tetraacyldisaccharide 4'-kinase